MLWYFGGFCRTDSPSENPLTHCTAYSACTAPLLDYLHGLEAGVLWTCNLLAALFQRMCTCVCVCVCMCACACVPCTCVCVMHVFGCICTRVRVCVHECTSSVEVTEGAPLLRSTNPEGAPTNTTLSVHMCMCVNVCMRLCTRVHMYVHVRILCVFFSLWARVHICICAPANGFQCACACLLASLHERA